MANLNIEGRNVNISFNISGKDHLKQKAREFLSQKQAFVMRSEIGGESMECCPENGIIIYQPRGETIYCDSVDAFMFQIGMVMMFCIDIVALPNSLPSNLKPLLPHGI